MPVGMAWGMHVERLERLKPAIDLAMMRILKSAFDPLDFMNPGKILWASQAASTQASPRM